jgi:hypothetical protein
MNKLDECRQTLAQIRYEASAFRADLKFRKFLRAVKAGFNASPAAESLN